jgi:hypothetical protein
LSFPAKVQCSKVHLKGHIDAVTACLCPAGLLKRYGLDISSSDILQATLDGDGLPVCVVAESAELNR